MSRVPPKYINGCCNHCGGPKKSVNPAWLRTKRESAGRSLRALARQMGYSASFLSDVELGRRNANKRVIATYESLKSA